MPEPVQEGGSMSACNGLGLLFIALSLFFLIDVALPASVPAYCTGPNAASFADSPECNRTRPLSPRNLVLGPMLFISGCIFMAAAWRPR